MEQEIRDTRAMVRQQIAGRGIGDERVLRAMREVPREAFVEPHLRDYAYADAPLLIGEGQTISQPYIVALMIEAARVEPGDRVLEVGTGSGYTAAVLSRIALEVIGIEWHKQLAEQARTRLAALGYSNVRVIQGDGSAGCLEASPFDAIIVSAGGVEVPTPLLDQLAVGGCLVIPVGEEPGKQELFVFERTSELHYDRMSLGWVSFVPLLGPAD